MVARSTVVIEYRTSARLAHGQPRCPPDFSVRTFPAYCPALLVVLREAPALGPRLAGTDARYLCRAALLTVCSQTVRIHLDVAVHVCGKHAGQANKDVQSWTSRDELVGFKSRHSAPPLAASANHWSDSICQLPMCDYPATA